MLELYASTGAGKVFFSLHLRVVWEGHDRNKLNTHTALTGAVGHGLETELEA